MFLKRVDVSGFASLKDASLPLNDLTVLVGPNNSGKSNVLNAIEFLSEAYRTNLAEALRESNISYFLTKTRTRQVREMSFGVVANLSWSRHRAPKARLALAHHFTLVPVIDRTGSTFRISRETLSFAFDDSRSPLLFVRRRGTSLKMISPYRLSETVGKSTARQLAAVRDIVNTLQKSGVK